MTSSISNSNRVFGLSGSGIDVDAAVEKLMTAARAPYVKLGQQQTLTSWKKESYNSTYKSVEDFRNNKVFNFQMKSTLDAKTVTNSNSSAVSVSANGDAINVNHSITVSQLASGVTESSTARITTGTSKSTMAQQFGLDNSSFAIKINGQQIAVNPSQSINDLVNSINKSGAGVLANYDATQDRMFIYTNTTGASVGIDFTGSSTAGLNFITNKLKLNTVSNVNSTGISSGSTIGFTDTASLQSQFAGLTGSFNLKLKVAGVDANIAIDTTKTSLNDVITQINSFKDSNGIQLASASMGADGKLKLNAVKVGDNIDLAGSDATAIDFLNNQLKLGVGSNAAPDLIDSTGVTSTGVVGFDQTAKLATSFVGLSGILNFKISDGTKTGDLAIDTAGKSMAELLSAINGIKDDNNKSIAVATFEHGKFTIKAAAAGATLDLAGSDSNAINFMTQRLNLVSQKGQDAQIKLDGVNMNQSTNKFIVSGVTYNVQSTGTSTVSVQNDTDKIVSSVKTFIDDYNKLLSSINSKVTESKYKDYLPLTDDQKTAMKESDITLWTDKAKSGLLHNDPTLRSLSNSMRSAFSAPVAGLSGKYTTASSIGISTGVDWSENGKLYIDEDKLKKALQEDPDAVYKIFGTTSTVDSENGIAVKLSKSLKTASADIVKQAGITAATTSDITSVLGKEFKAYTTKMTEMNTKLIKKENQYYKQYSAMESALSKLSQQSSYVTSMLGNS